MFWPLAPIPKRPPNVADVIGIVAPCPFDVNNCCGGVMYLGFRVLRLVEIASFA